MQLPLGTIARGGDDLRQYFKFANTIRRKLRHVTTAHYDNALLALTPLGQLARIHQNATSMFADGPKLEDKIEKRRRKINGEGVEESIIRSHLSHNLHTSTRGQALCLLMAQNWKTKPRR